MRAHYVYNAVENYKNVPPMVFAVKHSAILLGRYGCDQWGQTPLWGLGCVNKLDELVGLQVSTWPPYLLGSSGELGSAGVKGQGR